MWKMGKTCGGAQLGKTENIAGKGSDQVVVLSCKFWELVDSKKNYLSNISCSTWEMVQEETPWMIASPIHFSTERIKQCCTIYIHYRITIVTISMFTKISLCFYYPLPGHLPAFDPPRASDRRPRLRVFVQLSQDLIALDQEVAASLLRGLGQPIWCPKLVKIADWVGDWYTIGTIIYLLWKNGLNHPSISLYLSTNQWELKGHRGTLVEFTRWPSGKYQRRSRTKWRSIAGTIIYKWVMFKCHVSCDCGELPIANRCVCVWMKPATNEDYKPLGFFHQQEDVFWVVTFSKTRSFFPQRNHQSSTCGDLSLFLNTRRNVPWQDTSQACAQRSKK